MNLSELAQKNLRVKFWKQTLLSGSLNATQNLEMAKELGEYSQLLNHMLKLGSDSAGLISLEDSTKLIDLERKLEQLAETARLESGRSTLL